MHLKTQHSSRANELLTFYRRHMLLCTCVSQIDSIVKTWRSSKPACHLHLSNHHSPTKDLSLSWEPSAQRASSQCQRRAPSQPVPAGYHAPRRRAAATSTLSELRAACKCALNVSVVCRIRSTRTFPRFTI